MTHNQQNTVSPSRLVAVLCLLAYLFGATPLLPMGTALVAWLDGDHYVSLNTQDNGLKIVLHHDNANTRTALTHSHCLVAGALVLMSKPSCSSEPDHVLSFRNGSSTALREVSAPLLSSRLQAQIAPSLAALSLAPAPIIDIETPLLPIPPPALSVSIVRATIFLI